MKKKIRLLVTIHEPTCGLTLHAQDHINLFSASVTNLWEWIITKIFRNVETVTCLCKTIKSSAMSDVEVRSTENRLVGQLVVSQSWSVMWLDKVQSCLLTTANVTCYWSQLKASLQTHCGRLPHWLDWVVALMKHMQITWTPSQNTSSAQSTIY